MRSGPAKGPYEIRPVNGLPRSGPYYGSYKIRPFKILWAKLWPISDSARQLDPALLGPVEARLGFLFAKGPFSNTA